MIDTVTLQFKKMLEESDLSSWDKTEAEVRGKYFVSWKRVFKLKNRAIVHCTFRPEDYIGNPQLRYQFSVPNVVYGTNAILIHDLKDAIDHVNDVIAENRFMPKVDLWEGRIERLDACYNHQVGDLLPFYVKSLQSLEYTRRETRPYTNQGVMFVNHQVSTKFYDKHREMMKRRKPHTPCAEGILRQETTMRAKAVKRFFNGIEPLLKNLTEDMLLDRLESDLKALNLHNRSIGNVASAFSLLKDANGPEKGIILYGILHMLSSAGGKKVIAELTNMHPQTLGRRLKKIIEAGLPLTETDACIPLPPLVIDRNIINLPKVFLS